MAIYSDYAVSRSHRVSVPSRFERNGIIGTWWRADCGKTLPDYDSVIFLDDTPAWALHRPKCRACFGGN